MSARKPHLFELDDTAQIDPGAAPPPPEDDTPPQGRAMQAALRAGRTRLSVWARLGWTALAGFVMLVASVTAWDFVTGLLARNAALGYLGLVLLGGVVLAAIFLVAREWAGFRRLRRIDRLRRQAQAARETANRVEADAMLAALTTLYAPRPEMRWPIARLRDTAPDQLDTDALIDLGEATLMPPLDAAATREVEAAARQVALLTAMIPLALVDVLAALVTNLRMIRRIAEIYGGRTGTLGNLRLLRGVIAHLVATGAVAVGEDMLGSVASGSMLSKLSRRFGEGVVNGALTARLGIAAMDVCRPLPFTTLPHPRTSAIMSRALTGVFDKTS
jgi:putative membrane protein